jgi:hypothetical protein
MRILIFVLLSLSAWTINGAFFGRNLRRNINKEESLAYGRSTASARAVAYSELAEQQKNKTQNAKNYEKSVNISLNKSIDL